MRYGIVPLSTYVLPLLRNRRNVERHIRLDMEIPFHLSGFICKICSPIRPVVPSGIRILSGIHELAEVSSLIDPSHLNGSPFHRFAVIQLQNLRCQLPVLRDEKKITVDAFFCEHTQEHIVSKIVSILSYNPDQPFLTDPFKESNPVHRNDSKLRLFVCVGKLHQFFHDPFRNDDRGFELLAGGFAFALSSFKEAAYILEKPVKLTSEQTACVNKDQIVFQKILKYCGCGGFDHGFFFCIAFFEIVVHTHTPFLLIILRLFRWPFFTLVNSFSVKSVSLGN